MSELVERSHVIIVTAQYVESRSGGVQGWPVLATNVLWLLISVK